MEKRVLKEIYEWLDLAPKSCLFFHKWTPWVGTHKHETSRMDSSYHPHPVIDRLMERHCVLCGRIDGARFKMRLK